MYILSIFGRDTYTDYGKQVIILYMGGRSKPNMKEVEKAIGQSKFHKTCK